MSHVITVELRLPTQPDGAQLEEALRDLAETLGANKVSFEHRRESDDGAGAARDDLDAFVEELLAEGTVWGLYGDSWARSGVAGEREALPFWSSRLAAVRCIDGAWAEYGPRRIDLAEFLSQWLTGMQEDGIVAVLGPSHDGDGTPVEAARLLEAFQRRADRE